MKVARILRTTQIILGVVALACGFAVAFFGWTPEFSTVAVAAFTGAAEAFFRPAFESGDRS